MKDLLFSYFISMFLFIISLILGTLMFITLKDRDFNRGAFDNVAKDKLGAIFSGITAISFLWLFYAGFQSTIYSLKNTFDLFNYMDDPQILSMIASATLTYAIFSEEKKEPIKDKAYE